MTSNEFQPTHEISGFVVQEWSPGTELDSRIGGTIGAAQGISVDQEGTWFEFDRNTEREGVRRGFRVIAEPFVRRLDLAEILASDLARRAEESDSG